MTRNQLTLLQIKMLLRAKQHELENYVKPRLGGPAAEPIDWLIADVALLYDLVAQLVEDDLR
jgi:hypothetical protein